MTIERLVKIDQMLGRSTGATAAEIGQEVGVTPRHARRLLDAMRDGFGAIFELQIVEARRTGAVWYRYRMRGPSAFSPMARRVA